MIMKANCGCLNSSDEHKFENALTTTDEFLESDCDEQLIIAINFTQPVKIHSLKLLGPADKGPKTVKLFINQPNMLDFDNAERMEAVQKFVLTTEQLSGDVPILTRFVKFQNVTNITVFIEDNQEGSETTQINHLAFYGIPLSCTNMAEFK